MLSARGRGFGEPEYNKPVLIVHTFFGTMVVGGYKIVFTRNISIGVTQRGKTTIYFFLQPFIGLKSCFELIPLQQKCQK